MADVKMTAMISMKILALLALLSGALGSAEMRKDAARINVTCILIFGDSSVDPGNNNVLHTTMKGNFFPYGKDFFNGRPTGRFTEAVGCTKSIPAFLDPNLKAADLLHGVSFASAASGYDDLTANFSNVLPLPRQIKSFMHYKLNLTRSVGKKTAEDTIKNAAVHRLGGTRLALVGVPPLGCMPLVKTLMGETKCVESLNKVSSSFNSKIQKKLENITKTSGMKIAFVDAYSIVESAMNNPELYGLSETSKGCCGTGTIEFGESCRGLKTCIDPSKYVFWDAVHPTEKMYKIIAEKALQSLEEILFI
ncbi:hypothetical protein ACLB2K_068375 [Fragaria x ananassa]